jgi:hypothetical protein
MRAAQTDRVMLTRGYLRQTLKLTARLQTAAVKALGNHANAEYGAATQRLADVGRVLDALCKQVELTRVALADEYTATKPDAAESVAA